VGVAAQHHVRIYFRWTREHIGRGRRRALGRPGVRLSGNPGWGMAPGVVGP